MNVEAVPHASEETRRVVKEIKEAAQAGDDSRAFELANAALDRGTRHPMLFNARATWFWEQGRYMEALSDLEKARGYAPRNPILLDAIGSCLLKLGAWNAARSAFDTAIAASPHFAQTHYKRGLALQMQGERQEAEAAHSRAVELDPDYADALGSLALIAAGEMNLADVQLYARRALLLDAQQPTAQIALALAEISQGDVAAAEDRTRSILRVAQFGQDPRANDVLRLLGDAFDHVDNVPFAFAIYSAVNAKRHEIQARRFATIRSSVQVGRLTACLENGKPWKSSPPPPPDAEAPAGHVFVLGFARSGTTLLETVLASHPRVLALDERDCFPVAANELLESDAGMDRLSSPDEDQLAVWRKEYWQTVKSHGRSPSGKVFVDKWPFNSRRLPLIARLFPDARVLFALRDPRDVVLSCFRHGFVMNQDTIEFLMLENCGRLYSDIMKLAECSRRMLPLHVHEHRYEDLVANFDSSVRAVCEFIGIEWSAQMRDFRHAADGTVHRNAQSGDQVRKGLYTGAAGQWRRYRDQLAPVLPILQPWVERLGYSVD